MELMVKTIAAGPLAVNCCILYEKGREGCIVIDPAEFLPIKDYLDGQGLVCERILLTHGHFDHTGGVRALRAYSGAPVCMHGAELDTLTESGKAYSQYIEDPAARGDIDVLLTGCEAFRFAQAEVQVLHTPGHSGGSVCYLCEDHLFVGDTLFFGTIGRTDFPGSDPVAMKGTLRKLYNLPGDYTVYPGHGKKTMLDRERKHNPFLRGLGRNDEA